MMTTTQQIAATRRDEESNTCHRARDAKRGRSRKAIRSRAAARRATKSGEGIDELAVLCEQFTAELEPQGAVEEFLVERIATQMLRYRRLLCIGAGVSDHRRIEAECSRLRAGAAVYAKTLHGLETGTELDIATCHRCYGLARNAVRGDARARTKAAADQRHGPLAGLGSAFVGDRVECSTLERHRASIVRDYFKARQDLERHRRRRDDTSEPRPRRSLPKRDVESSLQVGPA